MIKYLAQPNGTLLAVDDASPLYTALKAVVKDRRPTFLSDTSPEVKTRLATLEQRYPTSSK